MLDIFAILTSLRDVKDGRMLSSLVQFEFVDVKIGELSRDFVFLMKHCIHTEICIQIEDCVLCLK